MNVEDCAETQYGLITRAQALAEGMSESAVDRRLASGRWIAEWPGVYRIAGAPKTSRQRAMAAALWIGGDCAISHTTAARLLQLDAIKNSGLHVVAPPKSGKRTERLHLHHAALTRPDRVVVDGIPCTSATRTLVDCAGLVDGEVLETAFEHARRMGLTSVQAIERQLGRGRPGSAVLRQVLTHAQARPKESRLEVKLARLLRKSSLPTPLTQFEIGPYRVDYAWPPRRVICECDGFEWHGNRLQWKRDRRRIATIEAAGWRIVHVTWADVTERPEDTLTRLDLALRAAAA